ncbi:TPA: phage tail protein [Shigella flexneri]|nr:phage tail protein [Shigella flexneri]
MDGFDNLFDAALAGVNEVILRDMGISAVITSGELEGTHLTGGFDDPESISFVAGGIRLEDSSPCLFVKTADISQLRRQDTLTIGDDSFFVDRITPDDGGCCYIRLRRGSPAPQNNARMRRYDEGT